MGYKLKKIYVGQNQVRPSSPTPTPILHLSTDLTQCRSLSDVTAQGWTGIAKYNSGNYTLANGNGIQLTSGHNFVASLYYQLQTPLTTSNRVIMHCTGYGYYGSYSGQARVGISSTSGDAGGTSLLGALVFYNSGTSIYIDGTNMSGNYNYGYGNFDLTLNADLSTGAVSLTGTAQSGPYTEINLTATLTSSQIQSVISKSYLTFETICYAFYGNQLHSAEVTIY